MTETQTLNLQKISFKPYIPQTITISRQNQKTFPSKCYKYIHRLEFKYDKNSLRSISRLKYLQSFHPFNMLNPRLIKKLVKPYRKYLKSISSQLKKPDIQKLLPRLAQIKVVSYDPSTWKVLLSQSDFQRLSFNLTSENQSKPKSNKTNHVLKYRSALSRNLPRLRKLRSLNILAPSNQTGLVFPMLEIVNSKAPLDSLKDFHLVLLSKNSPINPPASPKIKKAIEHLTSLAVNSPEWFSLLLSAGEFKSLINLHLNISSNMTSWDFSHLSRFKDLLKLIKLSFVFTSNSIACEREFFENFTMAPALEYLNFTMIGFSWNEKSLTKNNRKAIENSFVTEAPYTHFFDRLGHWKNLKILALTIKKGSGTRSCPNLIGKFASLFLRRLTTLEKVSYSNPPTNLPGEEEFQNKPLELEDFWRGLKQSKGSLNTVSISSPEITFPVNIEALETKFPKLHSLTLEHNVLYANKVGTFWRSIPSLKHVYVQDLTFNEEKGLREFLSDVQGIPEEMNVTLYLDVEKIKQEFLIDCLRRFIEEVEVKGNFEIYFKNVEASNIKSYVETLMLVVNKGCFNMFKMDMKNAQVLLFVIKQEAFIIAEDLASEYRKLNLN